MFSAEAGEGFPSSRVDELLPKEYEGEESDFAPGGQNQGGHRARGGPSSEECCGCCSTDEQKVGKDLLAPE